MKRFSIGDVLIYGVLILACLACILPFYYVAIVSVADPVALINESLYILPRTFDLDSYKVLLEDRYLFSSILVSVFITVVGTILSTIIVVMAGYSLSKKDMPMRQTLLMLVLISMFFGGQMIPYYILIRSLGLINSIWVLILPLLVDPFYLIIAKNYFLGFPMGLEESARIDGANDLRVFFQIVVPTSKPLIASIALFLAVSKWNEWWHAMLFISDKSKWPMQMMLRETLASLDSSGMSSIGKIMMSKYQSANPLNVKMAAIMITALPILIIYPFIQKYLTKGLMVGSMKE